MMSTACSARLLACSPVAAAPGKPRRLLGRPRSAFAGGSAMPFIGSLWVLPAPTRWLLPPAATDGTSADGVSFEDEVEEEEPSPPVESLKVVAESKSKDLDSLLNDIEKEYINLKPKYQRQYVWSVAKSSRLVESVFAKLFIPAVVLHTGTDGVQDVVDGKQRLTTLYSFRKGKLPDGTEFKLQGLKLLSQLNGLTYDKLPQRGPFPSRLHFDRYALSVTAFEEGTSEEAVLRVYEDLNCGSEQLTKQQVRRAVYGGPYIDLLGQLAKHPPFQKMVGGRGMASSEKDQELVLRFLALRRIGPKMFKGSMVKLLNHELKERRHLSEDEAKQAAELFEATVNLVHLVYGDNAFKLCTATAPTATYKREVSPGLYDSLMQTFAEFAYRSDAEEIKRIRVLKAQLRSDLDSLCLDPAFTSLLKVFSAGRLVDRLDMFQGRVLELLGDFPRQFANYEQLKQELFVSQNQECALCRHLITDLRAAELDHRVPLAKGGDSSPSNAQLVHRECNRGKGARVE